MQVLKWKIENLFFFFFRFHLFSKCKVSFCRNLKCKVTFCQFSKCKVTNSKCKISYIKIIFAKNVTSCKNAWLLKKREIFAKNRKNSPQSRAGGQGARRAGKFFSKFLDWKNILGWNVQKNETPDFRISPPEVPWKI